MLRPQHFYNIFTTNYKWLVVIGSNLNLILTCHLGFFVKILWKYCRHNISKKKNCGAEIEGKKKVANWFVVMTLPK